jgi:hypothetical protein
MLFAATLPAVVKVPPEYNAEPVPSSKTIRQFTVSSIPLPTTDQFDPSHLAI